MEFWGSDVAMSHCVNKRSQKAKNNMEMCHCCVGPTIRSSTGFFSVLWLSVVNHGWLLNAWLKIHKSVCKKIKSKLVPYSQTHEVSSVIRTKIQLFCIILYFSYFIIVQKFYECTVKCIICFTPSSFQVGIVAVVCTKIAVWDLHPVSTKVSSEFSNFLPQTREMQVTFKEMGDYKVVLCHWPPSQ